MNDFDGGRVLLVRDGVEAIPIVALTCSNPDSDVAESYRLGV
jgi:hypothetical protein